MEINVRTHLIVSDIHEEYDIKWHGKICDAKPKLENGLPIFVIISSESRVELNTINMKEIEDCAKKITKPRGRAAVTMDKAYIYIKEVDGTETRIGIVTHRHIKTYAAMYDKVGYK